MEGLAGFREVPTCPLCDGPCTHPWSGDTPPSPYRFPDRLRHRNEDDTVTDPADSPPEKPAAPPRGRRRPGKQGPQEDRARKPTEDRADGEEER